MEKKNSREEEFQRGSASKPKTTALSAEEENHRGKNTRKQYSITAALSAEENCCSIGRRRKPPSIREEALEEEALEEEVEEEAEEEAEEEEVEEEALEEETTKNRNREQEYARTANILVLPASTTSAYIGCSPCEGHPARSL